jgi:SAM-dependent methyltransferase
VRKESGSSAIALSFDDGPDPRWTLPLLDILAQLEVRATFFPISSRARAHPEIIERMLADGHVVGLHGAFHLAHSSYPDDMLESDTRLAIEWLGVEDLRLWRPPGGGVTATTRRIAAENGLVLQGWSLSAADWIDGHASEAMLARLAPRLAEGAVILMHDALGPGERDGSPGIRDSCQPTLELVPLLVAEIRAKGLTPGPIVMGSELAEPPTQATSDVHHRASLDWGDLSRRRPVSEVYGFDRGRPLDRRPINDFVARFREHISGDVLEVGSARYTQRFGRPDVRSHVLDIDEHNPAATVVADLGLPGALSLASYDCVIITQTLQYVSDPDRAIANLWAGLRPGGTLLVSVPSLARIDPFLSTLDRWRWTPAGLRVLLQRHCEGAELEVSGSGNLKVGLGFLLGLAEEDLQQEDLQPDDADFPIVALAVARKPLDGEPTTQPES